MTPREHDLKHAIWTLRSVIADDAMAASHQTLAQYRGALLRGIASMMGEVLLGEPEHHPTALALAAANDEIVRLRAQVEALTAERTVTHRKIAEASEAMSWAMANCDLAGRSYFFERKLQGLRAVLANAPTPAPTRPAAPIYWVCTGEVHEGQETYTRHDAPVPMADYEVTYSAPAPTRPAVAEGWFSYDSDAGFQKHPTEAGAAGYAKQVLREHRKEAQFNGEWHDEVEHVCWGFIVATAKATDPGEDGGVDYMLAAAPQAEATTQPALPEHETPEMHDAVMGVLYQGLARTQTDQLWQAYRRALLAAAPQADAPSLPTIKGASLSGGYVIVTPAGFGADKAPAVRDAILKLFPISPEYQPRPDEADAKKGGA